jgi:uncharacterized surface protein with fasciclin (FAS1) repeats
MPRRKDESEEEEEEEDSYDTDDDFGTDSEGDDDTEETDESDEDGQFESTRDFLSRASVASAPKTKPTSRRKQLEAFKRTVAKNTRRGFFTKDPPPADSAAKKRTERALFPKAGARAAGGGAEDVELADKADVYVPSERKMEKALVGAIEVRHNDPTNPDKYAIVSAALRKTGISELFKGRLHASANLNLFAPSDAAFAKLPKRELDRFGRDPEFAKSVLTNLLVEDQPDLGPRVGKESDHDLDGVKMDTENGRTQISVQAPHDFANLSASAKSHAAARPVVSMFNKSTGRVHNVAHRTDVKHMPGHGTVHFVDNVLVPGS